MLPVLRPLEDRQEHPLAEMRQRIADEPGLTEEELAVQLANFPGGVCESDVPGVRRV